MKEEYKNQVALLLNVLPEVAREDCFALHGGTAINLFLRDMPRLSIDIVSESQLFGGKIIAALDRQHPRDLFDVKPILQGDNLPSGIEQGLVFCLLSSKRPINELLNPRRIDQRLALEHQFAGLSSESFTYSEFEHTRESLVRAVNNRLTQEDKDFIFGFKCLEPDWNIYDFERFPAIQWKLENLRRFKQLNALGYKEAVDRLDALLQKSNDHL